MTAYNVAGYIGKAVRSALDQTFRDFELVVVDDGSTDDTLEAVRRISDSRLRVVAREHLGVSAQLRAGIEMTRAPYVALLDADDLWGPRKLERHVEFLNTHPDVDFTFSWSRIIDEEDRDIGLTTHLWNGPISFSELLVDNVIGNGSSPVLRRKALAAAGGIDPALKTCHDVDAWLRIALLRPRNLCAIPAFLTFYRRRPGQLTTNVPLMKRSFGQMIEKVRKLAPDEVARVEEQARSNMGRFFAYCWFQSGQWQESLEELGRSFRRSPGTFLADPRNWKMTAAATAGLLLPHRLHRYLPPWPKKLTNA